MNTHLFRKILATSIGMTMCACFAISHAEQGSVVLEEIVVTAQKRAQGLQDIPAAVTAISGEKVDDFLGAGENIRALAGRVPSLQVESSNGRQSPRFYIRGLGNFDFDVNATQPVSLILDEVALENAVLKSLPLFDVERVEVLQGPQGTLFGRSTTAGVVKIDTVKPSQETTGYIRAGFGSRDTGTLEGALGGALSDTLSARLSVKYLDRDDWIDNSVNGSGDDFGGFEELAYRLQLLYSPAENFDALVKLHGFNQDGSHPNLFYANAFTPGTEGLRSGFDEEDVSQDALAGFDLDHFGGSIKLDYGINDTLTLSSLTSYDTVDSFSQADLDGGLQGGPEAIGVLSRQAFFSASSGDGLDDHSQFTQELRLAGDFEQVFYQVGVYYLSEDITVESTNFLNSGVVGDTTFAEQETTSFAIFGQVEYDVSERLSLTAGIRWTDDDKDLEVVPGLNSTAPPATIDASDDYISWELAANYDVNENWTAYGRVATASRGPVTLGRFGFTSQADTEEVTSIEFGVKADLFDGKARWNASVYTYEIDDQQLTATGGTGNTNELLNASKTEGSGFETELEAILSPNLRASMNLSYNRTEIKDSDLNVELCSSTPLCTSRDPIVDTFPGFFGTVNLVSVDGNSLPRAPEWLFNIDINYEIPIESGVIYASTDWNYRGDSDIFLYESVEFVAEERWIGGVRLGYRSNSEFDVALVGRNVTDEIVADGALDFLNPTAFINEPAFWGIEQSKRF